METSCPQCEAPNSQNATACDQCGFPLEPRSEKPLVAAKPAEVAKPPEETVHYPTPTSPPMDREKPVIWAEPMASEPLPNQSMPVLEESPPEIPDSNWGAIADAVIPEDLKLPDPVDVPRVASVNPIIEANDGLKTPGWKLVVVEGFSAGKEYLVFKDTMVMGRRDSEGEMYPDIDLEDQDDGYISRRHAVLRQQEDHLIIEDLGGENGTQVDMRAIAAHQLVALNEGQVLRLGRVGLLVQRWTPKDGGQSS